MARWQAARKGSEEIEAGVREERSGRVSEMGLAMVEAARRVRKEMVVCMIEQVDFLWMVFCLVV